MEFRKTLQSSLQRFCNENNYEFKPVGGYRSDLYNVIVVEMWESSFEFTHMGLRGVMNSTRNASSVKITETIPVAMLFPKNDDKWTDVVDDASDKWLELLQRILETGTAQLQNARGGYINLDGADYFVIETSVIGKF
jgi:hypothetical protein